MNIKPIILRKSKKLSAYLKQQFKRYRKESNRGEESPYAEYD